MKLMKIRPDGIVPQKMTPGAAGLDLRATCNFILHPRERTLVSTGIAVAIPEGFEGQVRPRSGLALKHGMTVLNSPGTIDSDYRGEVGVLLINLGREPFQIRRGDRIAQLVISPISEVTLELVDSLDDTSRGEGGYGSTD